MLQSYHELQPKPKTIAEFKDTLAAFWSALLEKAINNAVKDFHRRLQACVCQPVVTDVIIRITETGSYILFINVV